MPFVTLIGWDCTVRCFPTKMWQAACFLQKTNNYFKIFVVIKRKRTHVFVSQVWGCHYPPFTVGNTFCHPATILRFTKHVSLTFQSFVMANLRNSVTFHEKSGQGRILFECCLPYLTLPWLAEMVVSDTCSQKEVGISMFLSENSKTWLE